MTRIICFEYALENLCLLLMWHVLCYLWNKKLISLRTKQLLFVVVGYTLNNYCLWSTLPPTKKSSKYQVIIKEALNIPLGPLKSGHYIPLQLEMYRYIFWQLGSPQAIHTPPTSAYGMIKYSNLLPCEKKKFTQGQDFPGVKVQ